MKTSDEIWEDIGSVSEQELFHVMTKLFAHYEALLKHDPQHGEALHFFQALENALGETMRCNSNRR